MSGASRSPQPGQEGQGTPTASQGWGLAVLTPSSLPCLCSSSQAPVLQKPQAGGLGRHRVGREDGSWALPSPVKETREDEPG